MIEQQTSILIIFKRVCDIFNTINEDDHVREYGNDFFWLMWTRLLFHFSLTHSIISNLIMGRVLSIRSRQALSIPSRQALKKRKIGASYNFLIRKSSNVQCSFQLRAQREASNLIFFRTRNFHHHYNLHKVTSITHCQLSFCWSDVFY